MQYKLKLTKFQRELIDKYLPPGEGKWLVDGNYIYLRDESAGLKMFDTVTPELWNEKPRKKGGRREHAKASWTMLYIKFNEMEPDRNLEKAIKHKMSIRPCDCGVEYKRVAPTLVWCPGCQQHLEINIFFDLFNRQTASLWS
jgi:hypothetical protein